jgi:hypothetical protein
MIWVMTVHGWTTAMMIANKLGTTGGRDDTSTLDDQAGRSLQARL